MGIFQTLVDKYKDGKQKSLNKKEFRSALLQAASDGKLTKEEIDELDKKKSELGLTDEDTKGMKAEIFAAAFSATKADAQVTKDEEQELFIIQKYQGGSQGMSFRIMKGVSYRVGGHRGHITSETGVVAVSDGELIITSKRVIFRGDKKSFAAKLDNILDVQLFTNGFQFSENNKTKPRLMKFKEQGNHDIIGAVLSYAINHYGDKE